MAATSGSQKLNLRQLNSKGLAIAIVMPVILVGALVATLLGAGAFSRDVDEESGAEWLWTTPTGELARVNGTTASTDTRHAMPDSQGNMVQVEQVGSQLLMRDIATGQVSAIDLKTLATTATAETAPGEGVRLAMHADGAFIIDSLQGKVRQIDPSNLTEVGEPLRFPAGITGGTFNEEGTLWLAVPREGTVVEITPNDEGAEVGDSHTIASPAQDLSMSVLHEGVAVLNTTSEVMTRLEESDLTETPLELLGEEKMADSSPGTVAAVTVADPPGVVTVNDSGESDKFDIGAVNTPLLGAAVEFNQRIYVPDGDAEILWVYSLDGQEIERIDVPSNGGPLELYNSGGMLFVNAPYSNTAVVIDADGNAEEADKARDDILGGDTPPIDEPEDDPNEGGDDGEEGDEGADGEPEVGPPGEVGNLVANSGNGAVTLSWDTAPNNGAPLTKYEIEGNGETLEVDPGQQVVEIGDLNNGESYEFSVRAFNEEGEGPSSSTGSVTPSDEVPGAVESVSAEETADGGVELSWPEADDQGNPISHYIVEENNESGDRSQVGQADGTSHSIAAEDLSVGESVTFQITTVAENGATSDPSPTSEQITPFDVPDSPDSMYAETDTENPGSIDVSWDQPSSNGRSIDNYVVTAGGQTETVDSTTATLSGFADGEQVEVEVVAVNEAGDSEPATATANTLTPPSVSISGVDGDATTMSASFSVDDGGAGDDVTCTLTVNNRNSSGSCSQLTVDGLESSMDYDVEVEVSTAAGSSSDTSSGSTAAVGGESFIDCPSGRHYCDNVLPPGIGIYPQMNQEGDPVGHTNSGDSFNAHCYGSGSEIEPRGDEGPPDGYYDYHPGKDTTSTWIKIDYGGGDAFIPFAWFNINGEDLNSTGQLPSC